MKHGFNLFVKLLGQSVCETSLFSDPTIMERCSLAGLGIARMYPKATCLLVINQTITFE